MDEMFLAAFVYTGAITGLTIAIIGLITFLFTKERNDKPAALAMVMIGFMMTIMFLTFAKGEISFDSIEYSAIETMKSIMETDNIEIVKKIESKYILEIDDELYEVEVINDKVAWTKIENFEKLINPSEKE